MQDGLHGGILKVGRVAVLAKDALDQNSHSGTRRLSVLPVHGGVAFQAVQQFLGDDAKVVVPHHLDCALVLGQGVVEGDFLLAKPFLLTALVCGADVPGKPDQFLKDLRRCDRIAVVASDRFLQPLGEGASLHHVDLAPERSSPLMSLRSASKARFFFSIP